MLKIIIIIGVLIACIVAATLLSPSHRIDKKVKDSDDPRTQAAYNDINRKIDEGRAAGHGLIP
ncbi:hypothetical protein [Bifidobacterium sp. ESL0745]|uniref:hypothetical protein n=1 Tax=Bifidobacterium sp. ESL0745 TaxID=2983226 RepID=UPI0023F716F9|nr:hypothetical protein [Bifidobacterium sp. ESL0745]MDF7664543.1 hypothetical protein [Bifidobacterium sp. ESL0745]